MFMVSMEQIAQMATIISGGLTALALVIVGIVVFVRYVHKARQPDSDGGRKITLDEWVFIGKKVLPFVFKLIDFVTKDKEQPKQEVNVEQPHVEPKVEEQPKVEEKQPLL